MTKHDGSVWREDRLVRLYLETVRGAIPLAQEQLEVLVALLGTRGTPLRRFLDLGCGDGILAATVLGAYPEAHGVLADFSPPMLEAARERFGDQGTQVEFVTVDYSTPAWLAAVQPAAPFDAIVSGYSIHHQPDARKRALYAELLALLSPGGWFINLEHVAPATPLTARLFTDAFVARIVRQQERQGLQPDPDDVRQRFVSRADKQANLLAPVEEQCRWLRELGFADVDCFLRVYELAVFGGRKPGGA